MELSKMTEKMSKGVLNVAESGSSSAMAPILMSRAGKAFLSTMPGEVILASLDAISKFIFISCKCLFLRI